MTADNNKFYLYGVLSAVDYVADKENAKKVLLKFNLTEKKIRALKVWMQKRLDWAGQ